GACHLDPAAVDVEVEVGRGFDLGLGNIHHPQVGALDLELADGQGVVPFHAAAGARNAGADPRGAAEIDAVVGELGVEAQLAQSEVDLVVVDLAVGDLQVTVHERGAERTGDFHVAIQVA